jgi:hypothetical protein
VTLRIDGPDCRLVIGPTADDSATRLLLQVQADERTVAVELTVEDVQQVTGYLQEWTEQVPEPGSRTGCPQPPVWYGQP